MIRHAPFLEWDDAPLGEELERRIELPVHLENDLVALTIAEQWFGEGRGKDDFALVTVGAGVGYGLVMRDEVVHRGDAGLGLAGHFPLYSAGPRCMDGHIGCASAVLTVPSIARQAGEKLGRAVDYAEVLDLAASGDPVARPLVDWAARGLGVLVAAIANLTMVPTVILSGEGVRLAEVGHDSLRASVRELRSREASEVELIVQHTGFSYWARGAAAAAIERTLLGLDRLGEPIASGGRVVL
jgi:predicted NBD/HSP70 family sugar kinase